MSGFLEAWSMFRETYLTALLSGLVLSLMGVVVVARGQVFLAAAVAQAATLGAAVSLVFGVVSPAVGSVGLGLAAAWCTAARGSARRGGEEATAWVFLVAASLSVLLVAQSALGMKQVQALLASSLIGASGFDVLGFGALAMAAVVAVVVFRSRLVLLLSDPTMAASVGMNLTVWSLGLATFLGLAAGLSIRTSGLLFTFGCLALPPLVARNVCRRSASLFLVSAGVGVGGVAVGLMIAHQLDLPPGQLIVALLSATLVAAWAWAEVRRRWTE